MERSYPVATLACVLLVVAGVAPALAVPADTSPGLPVVGTVGPPTDPGATSSRVEQEVDRAGAVSGDRTTGVPAVRTAAKPDARTVSASLPPSPTNNTSARLALPRYRVTQSRFETVTVGMGSTLQSGGDSARLAHERLTIEREFDEADTVKEKRNVIDRALTELEDRSKALEDRERRSIRAYSDGDISGQDLVRRLARIDTSTRNMRKTLRLLRALSDRIDVTRFDTRIRDVEGRLEILEGPIRHRAAQVMAGTVVPTRIHLTASDTGVVMTMMVSGRYVREATDWDHRNASGTRELFGWEEVGARVEELYPWVTSEGGGTGITWRGTNVWRFRASHDQGSLTAYVDAATSDVFRETQQLTVDQMPTTTIVSTGDELRVTLERTYAGGPLQITVEDAATDAALNARVTVDEYELGSTGADGQVRTIEPRAPYALNVTVGDRTHYVPVERPFNETEG